jgi:hypothetical protein
MSATTAIALYAAVVATSGVCWQVFVWWRSTRTNLRVVVLGDIRAAHRSYVIEARVVVVNESPFEVTVRQVLLFSLPDDGPNRLWAPDQAETAGDEVVVTIPARNRHVFTFTIDEGDLFADQPVIARVWTVTGKEFLSPRQSIDHVLKA